MAAPPVTPQEFAEQPNSQWPKILESAQSPNFQLADFVRLVLTEMSDTYQELREAAEHSSLHFKIKPLLAQIQALRTLAETARYRVDASVRNDVLDLDGVKCRFVLGRFIEIFEECLKDSRCPDLIDDTIRNFLRCKLRDAEEDIRTNIKNAHKSRYRDSLFSWPSMRYPEEAASEEETEEKGGEEEQLDSGLPEH